MLTWNTFSRAGAAAAMLGEVIALAGSDFENANDQKLVADMYMAGKHGIRVDFFAGMSFAHATQRELP